MDGNFMDAVILTEQSLLYVCQFSHEFEKMSC